MPVAWVYEAHPPNRLEVNPAVTSSFSGEGRGRSKGGSQSCVHLGFGKIVLTPSGELVLHEQ
jgi:hypothetical protein